MSKIQNVVEKFQKLYISVCGSCRLIMPKCVSGNILKGYNSQNTWKKHLRKYKQGFLFLVYQRSCSLLCNSHSAMNDKWKVPERILIHSSDVIFGDLNQKWAFLPTCCLLLDYEKEVSNYLDFFLTSKSAKIKRWCLYF